MQKGFWRNFKKPVIGLAPMDGVTDAPFRFITAKYGQPDLQITEFTSVEGICAGAIKTLQAFLYDGIERPIVAQVFGNTPECFYKAAFVVAELGFDGIDINMGCPALNVASKGAGAALILTPELAKTIVKETKRAAKDWSEGKAIEEAGLPENILAYVQQTVPTTRERRHLPVSIKTRIGYNSIVIEEWVKHLLETEPANISIHGRTLKQLYSGTADWEAIGRAADIIHQTETIILGNGDIKTLEEAQQKINEYGVDGVLIGRATMGNPWVFQGKEIDIATKLQVAIEHAQIFEQYFNDSEGDERRGNQPFPPRHFMPMRKHLAWYCRGFHGASETRQKLMQANNANEVKIILEMAMK